MDLKLANVFCFTRNFDVVRLNLKHRGHYRIQKAHIKDCLIWKLCVFEALGYGENSWLCFLSPLVELCYNFERREVLDWFRGFLPPGKINHTWLSISQIDQPWNLNRESWIIIDSRFIRNKNPRVRLCSSSFPGFSLG